MDVSRVILYDCRDRGGVSTVRLFDAAGEMILQGVVRRDDPREWCESLASAACAEYQVVGGPQVVVGSAAEEKAATPQEESGTAVPHSKERWLF